MTLRRAGWEEADGRDGLGETIAALMPEHPARTILIRLRETAETKHCPNA